MQLNTPNRPVALSEQIEASDYVVFALQQNTGNPHDDIRAEYTLSAFLATSTPPQTGAPRFIKPLIGAYAGKLERSWLVPTWLFEQFSQKHWDLLSYQESFLALEKTNRHGQYCATLVYSDDAVQPDYLGILASVDRGEALQQQNAWTYDIAADEYFVAG